MAVLLALAMMLCGALAGSLSDWMSQAGPVMWNKTLFDILLPGTHDAGAFHLGSKFVPNGEDEVRKWVDIAKTLGIDVTNVIKNWGLAHTGDLRAQLEVGYRYLDLRPVYSEGHWYVEHALIGDRLDLMLYPVRDFIDENPDEVIILDMSHTYVSEIGYDVNGLLFMVEGIFGARLIDHSTPIRDLTFFDMKQKKQRVLAVLAESFDEKRFPNVHTWGLFNGYYANADDKSVMLAHNDMLMKTVKDSAHILQVSHTLTASTSIIAKGIWPGNPGTLIDWTRWYNDDVVKWVDLHEKELRGVIVMVDNSLAMEALVDLCLKLAKEAKPSHGKLRV